jgi:hypothetical protein
MGVLERIEDVGVGGKSMGFECDGKDGCEGDEASFV